MSQPKTIVEQLDAARDGAEFGAALGNLFADLSRARDVEEERARRPIVYIAGPMSGLPEFNFPAFHAAAADLRARGYVVVSPAELHDGGRPPTVARPWEWYMRHALVALLGCDEVVLLPGWEASRGAVLEEHLANALGMPVCAYVPTGVGV